MVLSEQQQNMEIVRNGRRNKDKEELGTRSPNSNNGHAISPSSSSEDENASSNKRIIGKKSGEYEAEKIRVGRDYQAVCPELVPTVERRPDQLNDRALLVWSPTKEITDIKLEEYISVAKDKYGYNGEQALGMLFWHKHDLERAVMDLANFTPFPDEWTIEDKVLFDQAFQFHGKSFHRIRQMLPDKSIPSLVKYYYSWKKTRSRTSVMDRQEKIKKNDGSENGSENGSNEDSDNEEKKWPIHRGIRRGTGSPPPPSRSVVGVLKDDQSAPTSQASVTAGGGSNANNGGSSSASGLVNSDKEIKKGGGSNSSSAPNNNSNAAAAAPNENKNNIGGAGLMVGSMCCGGCGVPCNHINSTPQGKLCNSCYHHWRRTGTLRPTTGPSYLGKRSRNNSGANERHKRKPPRGMHINHDDIVALATHEADQANRNDALLATMDREIVSLLCQIQQNKQNVSSLKRKNSDASDELRPSDTNNLNNKQNARWNNEEVLLAVQGVKKFGKDFQAIADTIGTKTQAQVRLFYTNQRRRYDLDSAMREFQRNQQNLASNNNGTNGSTVGEIMEIDLDDDSLDNSTKVDAKDKSDSKELTIIPEGLDTNEITITKATSGDGSSAAKKFKVNDSAITITENSLLTPPSSQITITATTTTTPINSSSSVSAAAVGNSTTVIDDDDDDVIIEGTSMANTTSSGLKSAVSATIK